METNLEDIYAAGDVAQVYDPASGKWVVESLWVTANAQGRIAGLNMAGLPTRYTRTPAINVTRMAGMTTALIGSIGQRGGDDLISITHGDSESWRDSPEAIVSRIDYDLNHVRIVIGEKTMIGAVVMGDQGLTPILKELIFNQVDISSIRSDLIETNAPVANLVKTFWTSGEDGNDTQRT
jgi:NADPH-dependent 2,4-dienoyl-CoA reductase/sulfur reductase-like enzyme